MQWGVWREMPCQIPAFSKEHGLAGCLTLRRGSFAALQLSGRQWLRCQRSSTQKREFWPITPSSPTPAVPCIPTNRAYWVAPINQPKQASSVQQSDIGSTVRRETTSRSGNRICAASDVVWRWSPKQERGFSRWDTTAYQTVLRRSGLVLDPDHRLS